MQFVQVSSAGYSKFTAVSLPKLLMGSGMPCLIWPGVLVMLAQDMLACMGGYRFGLALL